MTMQCNGSTLDSEAGSLGSIPNMVIAAVSSPTSGVGLAKARLILYNNFGPKSLRLLEEKAGQNQPMRVEPQS